MSRGSADPRPLRPGRGSLLIVSEADALGDLDASLAPRVRRVSSLFEAVGEVSNATASDPIEAVIVDVGLLRRPAQVVIESIRRLDPAVFMYLLLEDENDEAISTDGAEEWGFDGCLVRPLNAYMLRALLGEGDLKEGSTQAPGRDGPGAAPAQVSRPAASGASSLCGDGDGGADESSAVPVEAAPPSRERRDEAVEPPLSSPIGDVDLVEAMLDDPDRVEVLALRLIEQETGRAARIERSAEGDTGAGAGAPINYDGVDFGHLASPGSDGRTLRSWAQWLGRWLALASRHRDLRDKAYTDALTGAWNRRYFDEFLPPILDTARRERRPVTIMVFDIDDLKIYNDRYGHDAGDTVLRETVRLLISIIRKADRVCRIGGDEFAVIFADPAPPRKPGSTPLESIEAIARRFQCAICETKFPKLGREAPGTLSISAGLATFPWDGYDADSLLRAADQLAIESKRRGKNSLSIGPGAAEVCE